MNMKYYLVKYRNGVSVWEDKGYYLKMIMIIREPPAPDGNKFVQIPTSGIESVFILFKSDNLNEIVERAALEAL